MEEHKGQYVGHSLQFSNRSYEICFDEVGRFVVGMEVLGDFVDLIFDELISFQCEVPQDSQGRPSLISPHIAVRDEQTSVSPVEDAIVQRTYLLIIRNIKYKEEK
uniref:Uncharacterized protein n=1 Tax=Pristionchus pacificus TaxID=54126 RepID=A0A2A6CV98_PRIPA|eukprot:PDM82105.1 hypothetical protein PRIPAC_36498 [Pristionchus pacificus]